jgi:aspartyl-tRNA(Asn)/glutamyl-tRNA(Gln) amidotransferase subunit B
MAVSSEVKQAYMPTIGIECHVQLKTVTKLFSAVNNDSRDIKPNQHISHICLGMPGALPVLNEKVLELSSRAAFALGTSAQLKSSFDRKHYFYPDLPKGYQITQFESPIIRGGVVHIEVDGASIPVGIERAHLEEDAGKSTHPAVGNYSLVDLNRAGTPLLEIVSEPAMHSPPEARAFAHELYLLMRYADVSGADLYQGNMRFDVNVSVSKDADALGTRSETKNLNSFKSVEKAVAFEIDRQIELLEAGKSIVQETRGWDDAKQKTVSQRSKEEAHDYRYFPDPDIPPIELTEEFIASIELSMPKLPGDWRELLRNFSLHDDQIEIFLEAQLDDAPIDYAGMLAEETVKTAGFMANMMINVEIPLRREPAFTDAGASNVTRKKLYEAIADMVDTGDLSSTNAKAMLRSVLESGANPADFKKYAQEQGYIQVSDEAELKKIVAKVMDAHPDAVADIARGEMKVIGFLIGQVMKESRGKANPSVAQKIIMKRSKS